MGVVLAFPTKSVPAQGADLVHPHTLTQIEWSVFEAIRDIAAKRLPAPTIDDVADEVGLLRSVAGIAVKTLQDRKIIAKEMRGQKKRYLLAGGLKTDWSNPRRDGGKPMHERRKRPCMCCNTPFLSEGIHNRLCKNCR